MTTTTATSTVAEKENLYISAPFKKIIVDVFPYLLYHNFHSYNSESSPLDILFPFKSVFFLLEAMRKKNQFLLKNIIFSRGEEGP